MTSPTVPLTHTKTKGDVAEAYVTARLLEHGWTVLKPVGDNCRYDLVIERAGTFHRVQCKTGAYNPRSANVIVFPACSSACPTNGGKRAYRGDADYFGVWFPPLRRAYLVPVEHVGVSNAALRLEPARNGQTKGVRLASDYEI